MTVEQLERRETSINKLHTLLETRNETLALYNQLAGMRPFDSDDNIQMMLQEFCETLVDYTASAHFQLYRFLEEGNERRQAVRSKAEKIYPSISTLTESILDFNEKYDIEEGNGVLDHLDRDLSQLGEILADRILLEDQIISVFSNPTIN